MQKTVPGGTVARRIADMLACGLTIEEIAEAAGLPAVTVTYLQTAPSPSAQQKAAIVAADEELMGPMPDRDDIDEVVVDRLVAGGYRGPWKRAERLEAIRVMHSHGCTYEVMSQRLGVDHGQLHRYLKVLGLTVPKAQPEPEAEPELEPEFEADPEAVAA